MNMESHFGRVVTTGNNEDELMKPHDLSKPNDVGLPQRQTFIHFFDVVAIWNLKLGCIW